MSLFRKHRTGGYCVWCDGTNPDPAPDCPPEGSLAEGRARAGANIHPEYLGVGHRSFELEPDSTLISDPKLPEPTAHVLAFFDEHTEGMSDGGTLDITFYNWAHTLVELTPWNQELTLALRCLLEAKDNAVRATKVKP